MLQPSVTFLFRDVKNYFKDNATQSPGYSSWAFPNVKHNGDRNPGTPSTPAEKEMH